MVRFLISGPMFLFVAACFLSIAAALGVDIAALTDILLVITAIFVGTLVFLSCLRRQCQSSDDHLRSDYRDLAREASDDDSPHEEHGKTQEDRRQCLETRPKATPAEESCAAAKEQRSLSLASPSDKQ